MRGRICCATVALACVLAPAAAAKPDPRVPALQRQVAALQVEVRQLRVAVVAQANLVVCDYALNQDSFQVVFGALSKIVGAITGTNIPAWEAIPRFDDKGACAALGISR